MKRADLIMLSRALCSIPLLVLGLDTMVSAQAQSARFILIDAREGLTPEVKAAYAQVACNTTTFITCKRAELDSIYTEFLPETPTA